MHFVLKYEMINFSKKIKRQDKNYNFALLKPLRIKKITALCHWKWNSKSWKKNLPKQVASERSSGLKTRSRDPQKWLITESKLDISWKQK